MFLGLEGSIINKNKQLRPTCLLPRFVNFFGELRLTESRVGTAPGTKFLLHLMPEVAAKSGLAQQDSSK